MSPDDKHMRLKGVGKAAIKNIEHEAYRQCIYNELKPELIQQEVTVPLIRAKAHNIYSILSRKVGLSCNDAKRFILADNIHTLAFGHYKTSEARSKMASHLRIKKLEAAMRRILDGEEDEEILFNLEDEELTEDDIHDVPSSSSSEDDSVIEM